MYHLTNGVGGGGELDCDVDARCCWANAAPPADTLQWRQGQIQALLFLPSFKKPAGLLLGICIGLAERVGDGWERK